MMKIFLFGILFFAGLLVNAQSQTDPPYKKFPTTPPFKLLLTDSTTTFTKDDLSKKRPVMIMLFSPDCEHCQHETEQIIKHIDEFKNVQIVMSTTLPFEKMKDFYTKYGLSQYHNITVGRDPTFMLPVFYNIRNLPFLAFYNKNGELISVFEGSMPIENVIEEVKK